MLTSRLRGVVAAGAIAGLAVAFAPALPAAEAPTLDVVTAADLGLPYAPKLVHVDAPTLAARNAVIALGLDDTHHASNDYIEIVLSSQAEEDVLREAGFDFTVEIEDLVADTSRTLAEDAAWAAEVGISALPSGNTEYRFLEDYDAEVDELAAASPDIAKKIVIGQSVEGRDIVGVEIGARVQEPEDGRPVFLMFGVHHAREWPSAEMTLEFAYDLINGWNDPAHDHHERVVDLLERARFIAVPLSNPDGFNVSRNFSANVNSNSNGPAWWRKNCSFVPGNPAPQPEGLCEAVPAAAGQTSPIGVDLNRNYGGLWGGPGADNYPASGTYHGPAPFSEPETQAIRELISTRQVTTLITNHTRGHLLLRPNGVAPSTISPDGFPRGYAPDECFTLADGSDYGLQALGERMTAQNGYSNQFGWELYDTTGTTEDYSYNATGGYGYTFELMPPGGSFHPNYSVVVEEYTGTNTKSRNLAALAGTADGQAAAEALTTAGKDDCSRDGATHVDHTEGNLGGGLRESYFIALENAANAATHSLITGTAPEGSVITVSRTGEFPTWGDPTTLQPATFTDTVETSMVVGATGTFEYHVNPSTRPIMAARRYADMSDPLATIDEQNQLPPAPFGSTDVAVEVPAGAAFITATLSSAAASQDDYDLELIDPSGRTVSTAAALGSAETVSFQSPDGIAAGTWTLRVVNFAAASPWSLTGLVTDGGTALTPQMDEMWTVSCDGGDGVDVLVRRGESVDVGELCA